MYCAYWCVDCVQCLVDSSCLHLSVYIITLTDTGLAVVVTLSLHLCMAAAGQPVVIQIHSGVCWEGTNDYRREPRWVKGTSGWHVSELYYTSQVDRQVWWMAKMKANVTVVYNGRLPCRDVKLFCVYHTCDVCLNVYVAQSKECCRYSETLDRWWSRRIPTYSCKSLVPCYISDDSWRTYVDCIIVTWWGKPG